MTGVSGSRSGDKSQSKSGAEEDESLPTQAWHTVDVNQVFKSLDSDAVRGLTQSEATRRLAHYGPNALSQSRQRSTLKILLAQFKSLIMALLAVATTISFAMGEVIEAVAILIVIVINVVIGFVTEWKAAVALSALQKQSVRISQVIRDGVESTIPAADLVSGDLIVLATGARVPADGRIVECERLQIEEAALTGESSAVSKQIEPIEEQNVAVADRLNMAFLATTITDGRGRLLVTATGARTEVGKIGKLIDDAASRASPLEQKLAGLGRLLIVLVLALCTIIVLMGWLRGVGDLVQMLEIGLSLAIAAVPEGLPAVATMTLALGMLRMAKMGALVRRLPAVETLGSTTVICTDKTGTLTKNEMTACVYLLDGRQISLSGSGYALDGEFQADHQSIEVEADTHLTLALRIGMLCNDAKVERGQGHNHILGDPTEAALIVAAEKAGFIQATLMAEFPRLSEVPFDSTSQRMITVHRSPQGKAIAFVKGAPAKLIAASTSQLRATGAVELTQADREYWIGANVQLADTALRVLALAYRELPEGYREADIESELTFVGLVGMSDPLRNEAKDSIATCRVAGIRTVMITGDQPATATEIARQLGIDIDPSGKPLRTVHGRELDGLDSEAWKRVVADAAVFARVSPEHKLKIVEAFQQQGHVVAMTGDGVNDAPAMKQADIGIAMGIKGTEVAKENADMVITDDDFTSIVRAVEQGRIIYGNILRFLLYLLSCNLSEILTVFVALMIGWPLPLVALQILWLNLITDIFPAFALALEPSAPDVMKRPPRDPKESLLSPGFIVLVVWQGLLLTAVTLTAFWLGMRWYGTSAEGLRRAATMAFMTLALSQVFHAFNARSQQRSIFTSRLFTNCWLWAAIGVCLILQVAAVYLPPLQVALRTVPLNASEWGVIGVCSLMPVVVVELIKWIQRFRTG